MLRRFVVLSDEFEVWANDERLEKAEVECQFWGI